ncbi:MAG: IS66 family insertion sequence element accessory protein TnpB [Fibrobacteres bacterium]|nr:IS66 family insertion sequence element accessory protein TnpB [Fibrobacterota bacterium]
MDVFFAHTQVHAAATWLASSKAMRHRLRERLLLFGELAAHRIRRGGHRVGKSGLMLSPSNLRILLCGQPADMRKSFNGLSGMCNQFPVARSHIRTGLRVFFNKRRDQVKALWWDETGYAIWHKKIGGGNVPSGSNRGPDLARATVFDPRWNPSEDGSPIQAIPSRQEDV